MKTSSRSFASITMSELVAGAVALALFGATLTTVAQEARPAPTATTAPVSPQPAMRTDGRPVTANKESRVLADPSTKMYMPCRPEDEAVSPDSSGSDYKANPKAVVMTEEAAKSKGFKASAHKVPCP